MVVILAVAPCLFSFAWREVVAKRLTEEMELVKGVGFLVPLLVKSIGCELWTWSLLEGKHLFDAEKLGFLLQWRTEYREEK